MKPNLVLKNSANLIVLVRTLLIFLIVALCAAPSFVARCAGFIAIIVAALLDWLDGYVARRLGVASGVGGLLDTLGDRITENLLLIFFAWERLIPLAVPLIFVTRSFASDFIRHLNFKHGLGTFAVNTSLLGRLCVSSKTSRAAYLALKMIVFLLAAAILVFEAPHAQLVSIRDLRPALTVLSLVLVSFNLLRFALLVYDSRTTLKEEFTR